jgi:hypothetical protein
MFQPNEEGATSIAARILMVLALLFAMLSAVLFVSDEPPGAAEQMARTLSK